MSSSPESHGDYLSWSATACVALEKTGAASQAQYFEVAEHDQNQSFTTTNQSHKKGLWAALGESMESQRW